MINYYDLFKDKLKEDNIINTITLPANSTANIINVTVPDNFYGFTTSFLLREESGNYNNFSFEFTIQNYNPFKTFNLVPAYIPLLPEFLPVMIVINKNNIIKVELTDTSGVARDFLCWIKIVSKQEWK